MGAPDLFPELIPLPYDTTDEARELAWGMVSDWFGTLSYPHNDSTHDEILDSLSWPGMADFVRDASLCAQDEPIDFGFFAAGVRHQARVARRAGLVVAAGKPRPRPRGGGASAGGATGDLFAGDDGRGSK